MMLRSVAEESGRPSARASVSDPTGSPVAMWSWISDFRISLLRSSSAEACMALSGAQSAL
jgi:hypothetical protein